MTAAAIPLSCAEPLDAATAARVRAIVAVPGWGWLTGAVRAAWERDLSRSRVRVRVDVLDEAEAAAMADFLRWPTHHTGTVGVDLARLDRLLRESGLGTGLAATLTAAGGPLRDMAGERRAARVLRAAAGEQVWADAAGHEALRRHPQLAGWLADERAAGRLPADPAARAQVLGDALAVLAVLPDPGTGLARLAQRVLGRAHALDRGQVAGAVLRGLSRLSGSREAPSGAAERRAVWASAGIAVDTVSSTVLTLGLTVPGDGPLPVTLGVNATAGLAVRLTLAQVAAHLDVAPILYEHVVFLCENPSVVEEAATRLGPDCPPLVCIEGRPSVAVTRLLAALRIGGAELRYHGDFDWVGLQIAADVIGGGAAPWRFGAADYRTALAAGHPQLPPLRERPPALSTDWDPELVAAMAAGQRAVEEEHVVDVLVADLADSRLDHA